ncbi:MAG: hypothetical protein OEZ01_12160 [Candidatus Heimdallarchaeota archaeon]|nr:hypothetical protein [Candidatus Heimdallarchaeota archaeon]MDH5646759.1 hypothetical protein [Candidatus Heimdallarchaeota archaeon]
MNISLEVRRKLKLLLADLNEKLAKEDLSRHGIDFSADNISEVIDKITWTSQLFKKVWTISELSYFFNNWFKVYQLEPKAINVTRIKSLLKANEILPNNSIVLTLNEDPELILIVKTTQNYRSNMDKFTANPHARDSFYWFPNEGILLSKLNEDQVANNFKDLLVKTLFGEITEFRVKSLIITKFFNLERYIEHLAVYAEHQVSGFHGMKHIIFQGDDVKVGLNGLRKRQDIRVHMHEIGPNIELDNRNLSLKIGPVIRLKNVNGIKDLHYLIYQDQYPDEKVLKDLLITQKESGNLDFDIEKYATEHNYKIENVILMLNKMTDMIMIRGDIEGNFFKIK